MEKLKKKSVTTEVSVLWQHCKSVIFNLFWKILSLFLLTFDFKYIDVSCSYYDIESKHFYLSKYPIQIPSNIYI